MKKKLPKHWKCYQDDDDGYQTYKKCDLEINNGRFYCKCCGYGVAALNKEDEEMAFKLFMHLRKITIQN